MQSLVHFDQVSFHYEDHFAMENLAFSQGQGEVLGVVGKNGAGKTTLIHLLLGFLSPARGVVRVMGRSPREALQQGLVGFSPDEPPLMPELTVREYLHLHHLASKRAHLPLDLDEWLTRLDMTAHAHKRIAALSRGMRQKVSLLQAFLHEPRLLVLDEPTSGFDPEAVARFRDFLRARKAAGQAILFSSHHLSELGKVCDRCLFIRKGRVSADVEITEEVDLEALFSVHCGGGAS